VQVCSCCVDVDVVLTLMLCRCVVDVLLCCCVVV